MAMENNLRNISLRTRLMAITLAAIVGMLALCFLAAHHSKQLLLDERKTQIKFLTQGVVNIVNHYYMEEKNGQLSRDSAQELARTAIRKTRFNGPDGSSDYFYAWKADGTNVVHGLKPEWEGKKIGETLKDGKGRLVISELATALATNPSAYLMTEFIKNKDDSRLYQKILYAQRFEPWDWNIGTGVYIDELDADYETILVKQLLAATLPIFSIILVAVFITVSVHRQIGGEPNFANEIMRRVSSGDFSFSIKGSYSGSLIDTLDEMTSSLREMLLAIRENANQLATNAEIITRATARISNNTLAQSESTTTIAAAIEQLTVSSTHISDSAKQTNQNSLEAHQLAQEVRRGAEQAVESMLNIASTVTDGSQQIEKLNETANQISTIANVIKDIAGQTNLLALNAAIEAARAGEQGRGFAVVADEVRKLAERTATATLEIESMITAIQAETDSAVLAINNAIPNVRTGVTRAEASVKSLIAIEKGTEHTLTHIQEVADATQEQSSTTTSIAQRVEKIARTIEETSIEMNETAVASEKLEKTSFELKKLVSRFIL